MKPTFKLIRQVVVICLAWIFSTGLNSLYAQTPPNDLCSAPTTLSSSPTCSSPTAGTLFKATSTTGIPTLCGNIGSADVFYQFTALTTNPTITLSYTGSNLVSATPKIQLLSLSAACPGGFVSISCNNGPTINTSGLIIGSTYYIRVATNTNTGTINTGTSANWAFTICVTDATAPVNNACASPTTLTSATTCTNTAGTMYMATNDGTNTTCGTGVYDVWYSFVAQSQNPIVTLSSIGSAFSNPALELLSGACGSTSLLCGTTSGSDVVLNTSNLIAGTTYRVRVFSTSGSVPATANNASFNICVVDPLPANDLCSNATLLVSAATCTVTQGNLKNSTASVAGEGVPAGCSDPTASDVWYKFVAQSSYPVISVSGLGSSITAAGLGNGFKMQLLEGTCGAFSQIACAAGTYNTTSLAAGQTLIIGQTYYLRISTLNAVAGTPGLGNTWKFGLCITDVANAPTPKFGNSYVNLSKKNAGGVIVPGDTLEVRMTIALPAGVVYYPRYVDNVPTYTTMMSGVNDSIRIVTNEGLTYKSYTVAAGDDAATYTASPGVGEYNIRMNFGFGARMPAPGASISNNETDLTGAVQMSYQARPVGGGRLLFATSFRVKVTGVIGDVITLGSGKFIYRTSPTGADLTVNTVPYKLLISNPLSLCANSTGVNSAQEFGGTFGNGSTLNRATPLAFAPTGYTYVNNVSSTQAVGDGQYGIIKNTSPRSGTNRYANRQPNCAIASPSADSCINRMFGGFWFIDGDHTGTNNSIGNAPPADATPGGYMLVVNADYVASEVYRQDISGLCPNTYYEFSAWIRNICPTCGVDSVGTQTYKPGVTPNLAFILDDVDKYTTGEIDTLGWIKKGFVFITGPSQTSATFSIRNNGQGGGGNDWVMDDISVATCLPNMKYSPSLNPTVCRNNSLTINDTISSYFNNYRHHVWQKSTNNGASWADVSTVRDSVPVYNPGTNMYQYITKFTIPPTNTNSSDSGTLYRVIVATTAGNVSDASCQVTDGISIINLKVVGCGPVLSTQFISFNGSLNEGRSRLNWTTSQEDMKVRFNVERSSDGSNFIVIGTVSGLNNIRSASNNYQFTDPSLNTGKVYYRIVMIDETNATKFTRIIELNEIKQATPLLTNVINPFFQQLEFDLNVIADTRAEVELLDMFGKVVRKTDFFVRKGINTLSVPNTGDLAAGAYVFRINTTGGTYSKKVIKRNTP